MSHSAPAPAPQPTFYPKGVVSRTVQLGICHDLARRLGYETRPGPGRAEYELRLLSLIGKRSLKSATRHERNTVISAFEYELSVREAAGTLEQHKALPKPLVSADFSDEACALLLEVA